MSAAQTERHHQAAPSVVALTRTVRHERTLSRSPRISGQPHQTARPPAAGVRTHPYSTFATKAEAAGFLAGVRGDRERGAWVDPAAGTVAFGA